MSSQPNIAVAVPAATNSAELNDQDRALLRHVDQSLADALELKRWWAAKEVTRDYAQPFKLVQTFNRPNRGDGFFDTATVAGKDVPVMGVIQEMLYDRADTGAANVISDICEQFREFVLVYFTRVSDFRQPQAYVQPSPNTPTKGLNPFSWCTRPEEVWQGFGYSQQYYKLKDSGTIGKFPVGDQYAVVDLREVGVKYEWIVLQVQIFDFNLSFRPFGPNFPAIVFPLKEQTYVILHKDFISNEKTPDGKKVLGRYGFGYALLRIDDPRSLQAYGPGHFGVGFQSIDFRILSSTETDVKLVFVVNRPDKLLNVPINPVNWGFAAADIFSLGTASRLFAPVKETMQQFSPTLGAFDPILTYISLANAITAGQAASQLCISKEQLEKEMLVTHYMQHYQMILSSLLTWRYIEDWRIPAKLPAWVLRGEHGG